MKPLEPGCRALVIMDNDNPANVGKVVTCHYPVEAMSNVKFQFTVDGKSMIAQGQILEVGWYITGDIGCFVTCNGVHTEEKRPITFNGVVDHFIGDGNTEYNGCFAARQLMRIDGFSDEDKQRDRELTLDTPQRGCIISYNPQAI